jgi:hypothetical protein
VENLTGNDESNLPDIPRREPPSDHANTGADHFYRPTTLVHIESLVSQHVEESAHLDFKRQLPPPGENDRIAKLLSAFANSDGGIVVYGIDEDGQGRADSLTPLPLANALERLDGVAHSLDGPVALESLSLPSPSDHRSGFLVVTVPRSTRAPHFHKGTAWGKLPRDIAPLTRRQIGDLFARQPGFPEEFNLLPAPQGRVRVELISVQVPGRTGLRYYLLFENDGNTDVFDVTYQIDYAGSDIRLVDQGLFPAPVMPSGSKFRIHLLRNRHATFRVDTRWRDPQGQEHSTSWPIGH